MTAAELREKVASIVVENRLSPTDTIYAILRLIDEERDAARREERIACYQEAKAIYSDVIRSHARRGAPETAARICDRIFDRGLTLDEIAAAETRALGAKP